MITSLIRGFPRRETCTQGPDSAFSSFAASTMRTLRRLAALQMPSTAVALFTSVGTVPFLVRLLIGTWIVIGEFPVELLVTKELIVRAYEELEG